jgi:serine/threonine-protein kinase ULK/ATG1
MDTFEWNQYIIYKGSIGKGSFSKVYRGFHKETHVDIALKKIMFSTLQNELKTKVISEIHIMLQMDHVNIIKLYDYKFEGDYLVLILEYCDSNLDQFISKHHSVSETLGMITQITTGMEYLHQNHIIHRDIKPQNILLQGSTIKIADFGFSILIKESNQMLHTICGTPLFMSPELLSYSPYTMKCDIWSLGILFYMLLYKVHPFGKIYSIEMYREKINSKIRYPSHELDMIPINLMLSKNPEDRPDMTIISNRIHKKDPLDDSDSVFDLNTEQEKYILEDDCADITGRGRTSIGYDQLQIDTEYFTPPRSLTNPVRIPVKIGSNTNSKNSNSHSSSGSSKGSFLSNSIDILKTFFSSLS